MKNHLDKEVRILLPSLKISGGNFECLNFGYELKNLGYKVEYLTLWNSKNEIITTEKVTRITSFQTDLYLAFFQLIFISFKFCSIGRSSKQDTLWIFTHYSTFILSLFLPSDNVIFFVQGVEWTFARNKFINFFLKKYIFYFYRNRKIITTNEYLSNTLLSNGFDVSLEFPIWANPKFLCVNNFERKYDFAMVLRKGYVKRLDLYFSFIHYSHLNFKKWKFAVITPDSEIAEKVLPFVDLCLFKPDISDMVLVYSQSRFFLSLSENEGFGLPPLESMGSGCVPICRNSGGINSFMTDGLDGLVLPLSLNEKDFFLKVEEIVDNIDFYILSKLCQNIFRKGFRGFEKRRQNLSNFLVKLKK